MNNLVQIISDEDGEFVEPDDRVWCLSVVGGGGPMCLCSGLVFGYGEGSATYIEKTVKRGGVTCEVCISAIRELKAVKL